MLKNELALNCFHWLFGMVLSSQIVKKKLLAQHTKSRLDVFQNSGILLRHTWQNFGILFEHTR